MLLYPRLLCLLACTILAVFSLHGQKRTSKTAPVPTVPAFNDTLFKALKWRNIGPFRGGRSNAVAGVIQNENIYYAGYTGGGIWKTDDAGQTWRNVSDGFFKTSSVGDIAVAPSDPNVVYAGMGEHAVRGVMSSCGDGVYKSSDGGQTWKNMGLEKTRHISDVVVHPQNPDLVFVAAQGAAYAPGPDRGIYKSGDGGLSWRQVLFVNDSTGASSLSLDPTNPRILYAATWQGGRTPWQVRSGGPGSAIWKSSDGGDTWQKIVEGLPKVMGKIGISVSRAQPSRVFAIVEAEKSKAGVYRSDDGGKKWTLLTSDATLTARSWYYMEIAADPQNADCVYVLNAPLMRSLDGGRTFNNVRVGHGDTHDLWINPLNSKNLILGDDGGGEITFDYCRSWSPLNNQPTAQFYRVQVDHQFPYRVYGGQQDNSTVSIASRGAGFGIGEQDWWEGPGCECGFIAFDPEHPDQLYGGCYQGQIEVMDARTRLSKDIMQYPSISLGHAPRTLKYRHNWNAPLLVSPHDPTTLYHAANVVFRSQDSGLSWAVISPDLTRNDTTRQGLGGAPLTNEGAGGETYNTINYLIESPLEKGLLYTGSDCGLVQRSHDGGLSWANVTPAGLPECVIHSIEVSPHTRGLAYICANRFKFNEFGSMVYKTTDYGASWTRLAQRLDQDFIKVVREDKKVPGLLYAGAEGGFYVSFDGGAVWQHLQLNLPVVPITDLQLHDNDLVVSTAGRSFWILDDVSVLQQSKGNFGMAKIRLFSPKSTVRFSGLTTPENALRVGRNPLDGVILDYYRSEKADTNALLLKILDATGGLVRTYTNQEKKPASTVLGAPMLAQIPAERGLNRFAWDLRNEGLPLVPDTYQYGDARGHRVMPGRYLARLIFGQDSSEVAIELLPDPRLKASPGDWTAQQQTIGQIEKNIVDVQGAVNRMRRLRKQIETYNELLKDEPVRRDLVKSGQELLEKIKKWEAHLVETRMKNFQDILNFPAKLNAEFFDLRSRVDAHDPRVTQGVRDRLKDLQAEWAIHRQALQMLLENEVSAYNRQFKIAELPALIDK